MKRLFAVLGLVALLAGACNDAPEPGDPAAFCSLLETGSGLTPAPTGADLERLSLVAPPAVRETIDALQNRARDFNELLAEDPPDLEGLFNARFDPQASSERLALDRFALNNCGIVADRPAATRWNSHVSEDYADALWVDLVTAQFEVDVATGLINTATMVFSDAPDPMTLVEDVCGVLSEFLVADGAEPGRVRVFIGSVVALEYDTPTGLCRLP